MGISVALGNSQINEAFRKLWNVRKLEPSSISQLMSFLESMDYSFVFSFNELYIQKGFGDELEKRNIRHVIPTLKVFELSKPSECKAFLLRNNLTTLRSEIFTDLEDFYDFLEYNESYPIVLWSKSGLDVARNSTEAMHVSKRIITSREVFPEVVVDFVEDVELERSVAFAFEEKVMDVLRVVESIRSFKGKFNGFLEVVHQGKDVISFSFFPSRSILENFLEENSHELLEMFP